MSEREAGGCGCFVWGLVITVYVAPWVAAYFAVSAWLDSRALSPVQLSEVADVCDERDDWLADRVRDQEARIDVLEDEVAALRGELEEAQLRLEGRW